MGPFAYVQSYISVEVVLKDSGGDNHDVVVHAIRKWLQSAYICCATTRIVLSAPDLQKIEAYPHEFLYRDVEEVIIYILLQPDAKALENIYGFSFIRALRFVRCSFVSSMDIKLYHVCAILQVGQ